MSPRQLRLHETTDGCDKGNKTGPFALAPGGLVAAPAAGLRGDTFALAPGGLVAAPAAGLHGDTFALAPGGLDGVVCYVNSTELRHIVVEGGVVRRPSGADGAVALSRPEEAAAQDWCR